MRLAFIFIYIMAMLLALFCWVRGETSDDIVHTNRHNIVMTAELFYRCNKVQHRWMTHTMAQMKQMHPLRTDFLSGMMHLESGLTRINNH